MKQYHFCSEGQDRESTVIIHACNWLTSLMWGNLGIQPLSLLLDFHLSGSRGPDASACLRWRALAYSTGHLHHQNWKQRETDTVLVYP